MSNRTISSILVELKPIGVIMGIVVVVMIIAIVASLVVVA